MDLMQCVSDCSILVASQTLSLGHWNFATPQTYTNNGELVDWQKESALKFAASCLKLEKKSKTIEKIQNQLLAISMFEPTNTQQICDSIVTNALLCVAQRRAHKKYQRDELTKKKNSDDIYTVREL